MMNLPARLYVDLDARRAARREVDVQSTLRADGSDPLDVRVFDVSPHGFACRVKGDICEGDTVTIGLRGAADGRAIVRWRRGAKIGCEFERSLTQSQAQALFTQGVVVSGQFGSAAAGSQPTTLMGAAGLTPRRLTIGIVAVGALLAVVNQWLARPF